MTLADILKHVFSEMDMAKEVNKYTVTHTNTDNYVIEVNGILIQVTKECK